MIEGGTFYVSMAYATAYGALLIYGLQLFGRLSRARKQEGVGAERSAPVGGGL